MEEDESGESEQEVWAQWNVIMDADVMLHVISYGFSDASIASCYLCRAGAADYAKMIDKYFCQVKCAHSALPLSFSSNSWYSLHSRLPYI